MDYRAANSFFGFEKTRVLLSHDLVEQDKNVDGHTKKTNKAKSKKGGLDANNHFAIKKDLKKY